MAATFPYSIIRKAGLPFETLQAFRGDFLELDRMVDESSQLLQAAISTTLQVLDNTLIELPESLLRTQVYNARKAFFQKNKCSQVIENEPVMAAFKTYQVALQKKDAAFIAYEKAWEDIVQVSYTQLQEIAQNKDLQRGLLFSSLDLLQQIPHFLQAPPLYFAQKERRIAISLLKYATRMATNTTPLSHFATIGISKKEPVEEDPMLLDLPEDIPNRRFSPNFLHTSSDTIKVTPNVALLDGIYGILLQQPVFYRSLKLVLNPMITGEESERYSWWHFNGEAEAIQELNIGGAAQFIVTYLIDHQRITPLTTLSEVLSDATGTASNAAEDYLLALVAAGLLSWELPEYGLSPSWCGRLYQYLGFLPGGSSEAVITDTAFLLQWLRTAARTLPFQSIETAQETLKDTADQISVYFKKYAGLIPPIPTEQLFYEEVRRDVTGYEKRVDYLEFGQKIYQIWKKKPAKPYENLRAKIHICLENGPLTLAQLSRALVNLPETVPPSVPVPLSKTGFPVGFLFQVFRANDGTEKAVLNAAFPGGGKLIARWLHLLPEEVTIAMRVYLAQYPNLYQFSWYQRFNANFQPKLLAQTLAVPEGDAPHQGILSGQIKVQKNNAGQITLFYPTTGTTVMLTDPGLEEMYSKPTFIQAVLLSGLPRVDTVLMRQAVWEDTIEHVAFSARQEETGIVLQRAAWRFAPDFWKSCLSESGFSFFMTVRKKLKNAGLPALFWVKRPKEQPQMMDLDSPLHVMVLEKIIKNAGIAQVFEEMLPIPEGYSTEIGVELGDV
jgi:hypothetical protein